MESPMSGIIEKASPLTASEKHGMEEPEKFFPFSKPFQCVEPGLTIKIRYMEHTNFERIGLIISDIREPFGLTELPTSDL
jgi:hypothetical protein